MKSLDTFSMSETFQPHRGLLSVVGTLAVAILSILLVQSNASADTAKPDFSGLWQVTAAPHAALKPTSGKALPLTATAKTQHDQNQLALKSGKNGIDSMSRCLPPGVPRILAMPKPFKIVQSDKYLSFLFDWNHQSRWVYINREHFEPIGPTFFGQSIAKWEGDTLVIDTTDLNTDTFLDDSGLPHSDKLHVVEHLRLKTPNVLENRITITDPDTFTESWETVLNFKKASGNLVANDDWCLSATGLVDSAK